MDNEIVKVKAEVRNTLNQLDELIRIIWSVATGVGGSASMGKDLWKIKANLQKISDRLGA
ncbi:MAG: hypothetical protein V3V00_10455 [Saprospiraceae bacterium]